MDEIITKTKELINTFEESDLINSLDKYKELIKNNNELLDLINKYNNSNDDYEKISLKRKINSYDEYKEYMQYYNKLFYYIMDINKRFKSYTNIRGCNK